VGLGLYSAEQVKNPWADIEWRSEPDLEEYQPEQSLEDMGPMRRSLFVIMHFATLFGLGYLAWLALS
jgi:hypothetical protein